MKTILNKIIKRLYKKYVIMPFILSLFCIYGHSQSIEIEIKSKNFAEEIKKFLLEKGPLPTTLKEKFDFAMLIFDLGITVEKDINAISIKSIKPIIEELYENDKNNSNLNFYMGLCYYYMNKPDKAIPHFEIAKNKIKINYVNKYKQTHAPAWTYYFLGKCYEKTKKYELAIDNFNIFKTFLLPEHKRYLQLTNNSIAQCNRAIKKNAIKATKITEDIAPFDSQKIPQEEYVEIEDIPQMMEDMKKEYLTKLASFSSINSKENLTTSVLYEGFPEMKKLIQNRIEKNINKIFVFDKDLNKIWIIEK